MFYLGIIETFTSSESTVFKLDNIGRVLKNITIAS